MQIATIYTVDNMHTCNVLSRIAGPIRWQKAGLQLLNVSLGSTVELFFFTHILISRMNKIAKINPQKFFVYQIFGMSNFWSCSQPCGLLV